tara:strand:- start:105 stop:524 length:420 start_codon:yes stop_codon:yes gene_type:complete
MKKIFFIALMLTGQLSAQIESGLYYSEDVYMSDVDDFMPYNTVKIEPTQYLDITNDGIRIFPQNTFGVYHAWKHIGMFAGYDTYILTNNTKVCHVPEESIIYYFYEYEYDHFEFKRLIEFRNVTRISDSVSGNYLMELE